MQVNQIRSLFLDYFKQHQHEVLTSSPLIPFNDPTMMFTNSGMVQFKNYFTNIETPTFKRAVTTQKCVRAGGKHNDLENVGYTARHHTFFEMLGNFSFGDYFKEDAIELAWKFLTDELKIDKDKLYVTIYHNDEEAYNVWKKLTSFNDSRIIRISTNDNFWSMGDTGPCGPCSEIFYDHGDKYAGGLPGSVDEDGDRFIEIWNLVFMQYEQLKDGSRINLPQTSIDTGMGLERISAVLQGVNNNYETDLFQNLIEYSKDISKNNNHITSHRVIADHLRAACFLIADGLMPLNEGRGYVLRRIMRRAMRHIHILGVKDTMFYKLVPVFVSQMGAAYPELIRAESVITSVLKTEEEGFKDILSRGMKLLDETTHNVKKLNGEVAFKLYDTYGFPLDLTKDILRPRGINIDEEGFTKCMAVQRAASKAVWIGSGEQSNNQLWFGIVNDIGATEFTGYLCSEGEAIVKAIIVDGKQVDSINNGEAIIILNQTPFYGESGGQIGDLGYIDQYEVTDTKKFINKLFAHFTQINGELKVGQIVKTKIDNIRRSKIRANHSATHLLHHALRKNLGDHVSQKGSIVKDDKLRFDFSHNSALTTEQIKTIEHDINQLIVENHIVGTEILTPEVAINRGAMALFGEKYGDEVRTVSMGNSLELCGGTHVERTGDIGLFKIVSEEAIASGVRRIEAITGLEVLSYFNSKQDILSDLTSLMKCNGNDLKNKISLLIDDKKKLEKDLSALKNQQLINEPVNKININGISFIYKQVKDTTPQDLKTSLNHMIVNENGIFMLVSISDNKISIIIYVAKSLQAKFNANDLIKSILPVIDGSGGGRPEMAQAGGTNLNSIDDVVKMLVEQIKKP